MGGLLQCQFLTVASENWITFALRAIHLQLCAAGALRSTHKDMETEVENLLLLAELWAVLSSPVQWPELPAHVPLARKRNDLEYHDQDSCIELW